MISRGAACALLLVACDKPREAPRTAEPDAVAPCERLPFAETLPIAEASGAVLLGDQLLVISDSGNDGAYVIVDAETGEVEAQGEIPLGKGASDDVEGLAVAPDGVLWGVTSSGWMRAWTRDGEGFALVDGYALAEPLSCDAESVNCGANLEGLCLAPVDGDGCDGYVAAKDDGHLYCLVRDGARYVADAARSIEVTSPEALADCAFAPDGTVWTGDNLFGGDTVRRVDPAGAVTEVGALGVGFPEVITVGAGGVVYRLSDTSGSPSMASRWKCGTR